MDDDNFTFCLEGGCIVRYWSQVLLLLKNECSITKWHLQTYYIFFKKNYLLFFYPRFSWVKYSCHCTKLTNLKRSLISLPSCQILHLKNIISINVLEPWKPSLTSRPRGAIYCEIQFPSPRPVSGLISLSTDAGSAATSLIPISSGSEARYWP